MSTKTMQNRLSEERKVKVVRQVMGRRQKVTALIARLGVSTR